MSKSIPRSTTECSTWRSRKSVKDSRLGAYTQNTIQNRICHCRLFVRQENSTDSARNPERPSKNWERSNYSEKFLRKYSAHHAPSTGQKDCQSALLEYVHGLLSKTKQGNNLKSCQLLSKFSLSFSIHHGLHFSFFVFDEGNGRSSSNGQFALSFCLFVFLSFCLFVFVFVFVFGSRLKAQGGHCSRVRFERSSVPLRPSRQWRCRRKPSDADVRRSCRVKETSRATSVWPEESHKIARVLSINHQLKIPEHQPKLENVTSKESFDKVKIRLSEINKHVSDGISKDREKLSW